MAEAATVPQWTRRVIRTAAVAGALLLAGCQTLVPRGVPDRAPPPPQQQPTQDSQPDTVQPGIPQDAQRHRIALLVPLSGPNAGVGQSIANATQLALLDSRNQQVRITTYDTATGAAAAAQRALAEGNRLILGPLLSEDVRAVAPIAKRAGVPVLSYSNDTSVAGNGAYVMGYSPSQSIGRVVDYAKQTGITSFAGLVPSGVYGQRASTAFLRAVESAGGQVVSLQTYNRGNGGIAAAVTRLPKNSPYQAVLIADAAGTAATAVPLLRRDAASARVLGTELWNTDSAARGNAALNGAWFASVSDGLYRQFATKYRTRFGNAPYRLSSLGYDSVLLTIRIARDWKVGDRFPEARLTDSGGFAGLDGAFRFGRDGVAERALEVQEVRSGTTVTVSPAPRAFE
jgi:ABC-type branched-subunit amino acid transport system substrate-binding protein